MTAEIVCVGTELLLGNIVNTNSAYLAEKLAQLGISCYYQTVVGDNRERMLGTIGCAAERSDIVILSGGLGPTEDDMTKEVVADLCGRPLQENADARAALAAYFEQRGIEMTENNLKQALVPEGGIALANPNGTAPGIILEHDMSGIMTDHERTIFVLLPGPPVELQTMFEESVVPYLQGLTGATIRSRTVKMSGVSESKVETMIKDLIDAQTNPTIATYAKTGEVHVRVTACAESGKAAEKLLKPMVKELKTRFGKSIYTTEEGVTLEKAVADLLEAGQLSISTAESCTGGMVAARLINVPGVSEVFKSGVVTYANKAKRKLLNVKKSTLQKYGAVSEQTAQEMAKGCMALTGADVTVAITGIAGPEGGTEEKPVGLVYIACNIKGNIRILKYQFKGNRSKVRENATVMALNLVRECVMEYLGKVTFGKDGNVSKSAKELKSKKK